MTEKELDKLLKEKLGEAEFEVPSSCWEAICDGLPEAPVRKIFLWRRLSVAAVALLAIGLSGYLYLNQSDNQDKILSKQYQNEPKPAVSTQNTAVQEQPLAKLETKAHKKHRTITKQTDITKTEIVTADNQANITEQTQNEVKIALATETEKPVQTDAGKVRPQATQEEIVAFVNAGLAAQEVENRLEQITNTKSSSSIAMLTGLPVDTHSSTDNEIRSLRATSNTDDVLNMLNANQASAGTSNATRHHSMPFSLGLLVNKEIYRNLMIQTGLHFTYLRSTQDVTGSLAGYESYSSNEIQKLYYLGIPISLNYYLINNKRINLYVNAGAMAEKNVAGTWTDEIRGDNKVIYQTSTSADNHLEEQLQWSVHTGLGVDIRISKWLNFYVEPAYTYFPDNGSKIDNIRKKEKREISVQGGLKAVFRSK